MFRPGFRRDFVLILFLIDLDQVYCKLKPSLVQA